MIIESVAVIAVVYLTAQQGNKSKLVVYQDRNTLEKKIHNFPLFKNQESFTVATGIY